MSHHSNEVETVLVHFEKNPPTKSSEHILKNNADVDLEDGPLFRATIKEYEGRTVALKSYLKRILKAATATLEAKNNLLEQDRLFTEALREAPFTEPLFTHYLDATWSKLHEQQERLSFCMKNLLIDPLQKLYDMDIKAVDTKRKQFEDCSKEYYSNLSKYLSIKTPNTTTTTTTTTNHNNNNNTNTNTNNTNNQPNIISSPPNITSTMTNVKEKRMLKAETEFLGKKSEFDLVRFDYYSFLVDLHGGKKDQEILYHLLNHHEKQYAYYQAVVKTLEPHKRGLDDLAAMIAEASREQKMVNQERDEKRKLLVSKYASDDHAKWEKRKSTNIMLSPPFLSPTSPSNLSGSSTTPISPVLLNNGQDDPIGLAISDNSKFKGIRDLEQKDQNSARNIGRKKEGFLFATSKPTKSSNVPAFDMSANVNWHKYWCVVSGGQLHEYSNWKKQLESHIEPINLRFATVREARNMDRRFCFEVITPNFRRMYQATSNEELSSWLSTINNAISSLLNGSSSSCDLKNEQTTKKSTSHWKHTRSLSGALSNLTAAKDKYLKKRHHHNHSKPFKISSPIQQGVQDQSSLTNKSELLTELKKDLSNTICADCSAKNPDWCSLNLGILICIECSGIHRSLGTHISKVRSLTLDNASYTTDIIQLLTSIGNSKSNSIWEAKLSDETVLIKKPVPSDTRDVKLKYIQSKYVDHALVRKPDDINPMDLLYTAVEQDDIPQALYAIAVGANVNDPFANASIPLLPKKKPSIVKLPVLDIDGNEYLGQTMEVTLPTSPLFSRDELAVRYALHLALLSPSTLRAHDNCSIYSDANEDSGSSSSSSSVEHKPRIFGMAELLFQNGADVFIKDANTGHLLADLIGLGDLVDDEAIAYLNMKNSLRGQDPIVRSTHIPSP